jgi:zinc protease
LPAYFKAFQSHEEQEGLTRAVFKSGLKVVVEEYPSAPLVAVVTCVRFNGADGVDAKLVARFIGQPFRESVASSGGFSEVKTRFREILFGSLVPADKILDSLESHVDLFSPRTYDTDVLKFLAGGVERERKSRTSSITKREALVEEYFLEAENGVIRFPSQEQYLEFHRTHFQPSNVIIAVSGSGRSEQVLSELVELLAEKKLDKVARQKIGQESEENLTANFSYHHLRGEIEKPLILMGFTVPGRGHRDYPALKLLEYVLGEGNSALLNSSHDDEGSNAFLAQASLEELPSGELFLVTLVSEPTDVDMAEVRTLALIEALKQVDLPPVLLDRAKALMLTDYYESLSQLDRRAYSLVFAEVAGEVKARNRIPQILVGVSAADLKSVLKKYFTRERLKIVEFFPADAEERTFSKEAFQETLGILVPGEVRNQISVTEIFRSDEESPRFKPPKFEPSYSEKALKRTSILRGPEIYVKEEHSMPLVHLGFFFPGGRINEVTSTAGITRLMLQAIVRNYVRRGGLLAAGRLEALGVRLSPVVRPDFFGIQAIVLSPQLSDGVWELLRWLRAPEIEEVDVELARADLLRRLVLEPRDKMFESARKSIYGDHPYGFSLGQISTNLKAFSAASVIDWKAKYLDRLNPHILALGDVQGTAFITDLVSELSDRRYRVGTASEREVPMADDPTTAYKVIPEPELGRAIMVFPGPEEGSDFAEMLDVALELLGNPNGLLTTSLTNERRLVDRVHLLRESGVGGGAVFIEVNTAPESLDEGVKEIRKQLNQFSEQAVTESVFLDNLVRRLTEHHYRRQVRADYILEIMRSVLAEEPIDYGERYILNVRQLRMGEIAFAVQRFLGEDQ